MINIKQHIRMYAEEAVKNNDLMTTQSVQSLAQADHKTWRVAIENFQGNGQKIEVILAPVVNSDDYQVLNSKGTTIWQGQFTEANFNSIMQNVLMKLNIK
ncbi:hypothetical protein [Lactobacillus sp. Sy-1]|uniref:hypothetical protein n=1 Tax=Lactobacillus sp. Sy-1 TaxID=2109645 RepID=UPI001C567E5F|nr:hypothetical protein [Lactobacillus sp. Sy-1]MBW1604980.1 hypothetical protein [Lactobacillus sp. Sy-1]